MPEVTRSEQVDRIVNAALAQSRAAKEYGLHSPERNRALAAQHAVCRAASGAEVQAALIALGQRDPDA